MSQEYRGIELAIGALLGGRTQFRVSVGHSVCDVTMEGLSHEWMQAYVRYLSDSGEREAAVELRAQWLASHKVRM